MSDDDGLLGAKVNRPPAEVGREIFRLLRQYDELVVTTGENEWDVQITPLDDDG
jgi:hypothetical protein